MMVSSILIYTDSYSIYVWNAETEVGPASFIISGESVHEYIDDIRDVPGIVAAETIELSWCQILAYIIPPINSTESAFALSNNQEQPTYVALAPYTPPPIATPATAAYLGPSFTTVFPELYAPFNGRLPENDSEIALAYWLAARFQVGPGSQVNYTRGYSQISSNVTVVGVFRQPVTNNSLELHYIKADVIVTSGLFSDRDYDSHVYADMDRSLISSQDPKGALSYLADLDEKLRRVDPEFRVTKQWTMFYIDDLLATGIRTYMVWLDNTRMSQMLRSSGFIFLGFLVSGVGTYFYSRTKRPEAEVLRARGASSIRIIIVQYRDVLLMMTCSIPLGIFGGFLISRLGLVCIGFFSFDFSKISELPFLLTMETIATTILLSSLVPILMIINQSTTERIKSSSFVTGSRLAKYTGKLHNIRWEVVTISASVLLLISIIQQGRLVAQTPDFKIALIVIPIILTLSITSLVMKGIKVLSSIISRLLHRIFGETLSLIGIRRIRTHSKFLGPAIMILVLTISLSWSAIVTTYTIPSTTQGHTRFAIGGDLAFKLDTNEKSNWDEFAQNVTNHELVESATQVVVRTLYMTSSESSATEFVSIKPAEFSKVGFDSNGIPLEQSPTNSLLQLLHVNPSGVVVTTDLSSLYDIQVGDTLRACTTNGTEFIPHPFTIVGIIDYLPDNLVTESGYNFLPNEGVGIGRVWANSEYVESLLSDAPITRSLLCVRMTDIGRTDELVESIIESGGLSAIDGFGIASASSELDTTVNDAMYIIERSIDTMLVIISLFSVIVIFGIYTIQSKNECLKENTILKTLGTEHAILKNINATEMLGVSLLSLIVLSLVFPFFVISSIMIYLVDFGSRLFQFPSPILITTPWLSLITILGTLVIIIVLYSFFTEPSESRVDLLVGSFRNTPFESSERSDE